MFNIKKIKKMSETRSIGLQHIKLGDIPEDGGMATTLKSWGVTYKGTATFVTEDGEETLHECEEDNDPIEIEETPGKTILSWTTVDIDPLVLKDVFGGEVVDGKWKAPRGVRTTTTEHSVEFLTKRDIVMQAARMQVKSKFNWDLGKAGIAKIEHKATILTPKKAGLEPFSVGAYKGSSNPA